MNQFILSTLVFLLLLHSSKQESYQFEYLEYTRCPINDCNDNGFCVSATACRCEVGFYGDTCENAITDTVPTALVTFQVLLTLGFAGAAALSILGFVLAVKKIKDTSGPSSRIRIAVFGITSFITILNFFLMAIDPLSQNEIIPDSAFKVLLAIDQPLCLITFLGVLLHWTELVQMSRERLNHENMLKQINANYPGKTITLEDIIESIKFLRKFRIPFLVLGGWTFVFGVLTTLFVEIHIYPLTFNTIQQAYFVLMWIAVAVGFFLVRKKLVALMPYQVSGQVRRLTTRVAGLSIVNLCVFILFSLMLMTKSPSSAGAALAIFVIERTIVILTCVLTNCIFLHFRKDFPYVSVQSSSFGSNGSTGQGNSTKSAEMHSTGLEPDISQLSVVVVEPVTEQTPSTDSTQ